MVGYISLKYQSFDDFYTFVKENGFRRPTGLEYKNEPIILFGGSFAWGWELEEKQTLQYKLSKIMKRPTYNRAYKMWFGLSQLLYQSEQEEFYKEVPEPKFILYVFMDDHILRMLSANMNPFSAYPHLRYIEYNKKLEKDKHSIVYNSHLMKKMNTIIAGYKLKYQQDKNFKLLKKHLVQTKGNFDKHWKDYKFVFYIYEGKCVFTDDNIKELENEGIIVIKTSQLTDIDLTQDEYYISKTDRHPNEKAWDVVVPKLSDFLNKL